MDTIFGMPVVILDEKAIPEEIEWAILPCPRYFDPGPSEPLYIILERDMLEALQMKLAK